MSSWATQSRSAAAVALLAALADTGTWTPTEGERAGETLTRLEVTADVVAPSLHWATAKVTKAPRRPGDGLSDGPIGGEPGDGEPPF